MKLWVRLGMLCGLVLAWQGHGILLFFGIGGTVTAMHELLYDRAYGLDTIALNLAASLLMLALEVFVIFSIAKFAWETVLAIRETIRGWWSIWNWWRNSLNQGW